MAWHHGRIPLLQAQRGDTLKLALRPLSHFAPLGPRPILCRKNAVVSPGADPADRLSTLRALTGPRERASVRSRLDADPQRHHIGTATRWTGLIAIVASQLRLPSSVRDAQCE